MEPARLASFLSLPIFTVFWVSEGDEKKKRNREGEEAFIMEG